LVKAALSGAGLSYAIEGALQEHLEAGRLVRVLDDWCAPFAGFFLYYRAPDVVGAARADRLRAHVSGYSVDCESGALLFDFLRHDQRTERSPYTIPTTAARAQSG